MTNTPKSNLDHALSFFSLEGLGAAARASSFDQEDFIRRTIKHAKSDNPKISIQGLKLFWAVSKDILSTSGQLTSISQTQDTPNGTITASSQSLLTALSARRDLDHSPRARPRINTALSHVPSQLPALGGALPAPVGPPVEAGQSPPAAGELPLNP